MCKDIAFRYRVYYIYTSTVAILGGFVNRRTRTTTILDGGSSSLQECMETAEYEKRRGQTPSVIYIRQSMNTLNRKNKLQLGKYMIVRGGGGCSG